MCQILSLLLVCSIGFAQAIYEFLEPENDTQVCDVTLIKEAGCVTERAYTMGISITEPSTNITAASIKKQNRDKSFDFSFGAPEMKYFRKAFPTNNQSVAVGFTLNPDVLPERLEAFQLSVTPVEGSPNFKLPRTGSTYQTTEVQIIDNDCKFCTLYVNVVLYMNP